MSLNMVLLQLQEIVEDLVSPMAGEIDREARWPEASLRAIQKAGLGGLVVSKDYGGLDLGLLGLVQACERIGMACPSTALCYGMHCVGSAVINAKASTTQAELFLEPIVAGQHLTTLALSEFATGAHFYLPETSILLNETQSAFIINGEKCFVTNGGYADSYVVSTKATDPNAQPNLFSCVLVRNDMDNITWGEPWLGLGMRGNSSCVLTLDNVDVPLENLLGKEGDQMWYIFNVVAPYFLMAMSGTYLGIAQAAFDEAKAHLTQRSYSHSGNRLANQAILQHRVGTLWAELARCRQLIYYAAQAGDSGSQDALSAVCAAKADVAHTAINIVNEAMTLCGGSAYRDGKVLDRALRNSRAAHVMSPTTDILYSWIGRDQLGLPLLGD